MGKQHISTWECDKCLQVIASLLQPEGWIEAKVIDKECGEVTAFIWCPKCWKEIAEKKDARN